MASNHRFWKCKILITTQSKMYSVIKKPALRKSYNNKNFTFLALVINTSNANYIVVRGDRNESRI